MKNCWLSPRGDVYYCKLNHIIEAELIVEDLNLMEEFIEGPCDDLNEFLEMKGYVKWSEKSPLGWCITSYTRLTQAQIDKIYELTGEVFEDENLIWPCCVRSYFFIQKNLNKCWEVLRSRDGGDRTPGYGSEDRRVAITPHP